MEDLKNVNNFCCQGDVFRPLAHFPKDVWGDLFLESNVDGLQLEKYGEQIDLLKREVGAMLLVNGTCTDNQKKAMDLINTLERLGISYHFEREIEAQLEHIFSEYNCDTNYDLYTVSVHFRIFRQHGYRVSCDIFDKFKDSDGKLERSLQSDVKGVLSLYEAAHLRMHNEEFLEDALDLATALLKSFASEPCIVEDPCLYKQVVHAIKQAFHTGIQRVETRHFIIVYEEFDGRIEALLHLAKLDFNTLQLIHRQELSQVARWWKDLDVKNELPYARDRSLECHFWALAMYYEARYSKARLFMSKVFGVISILDDTYDAYGTIEELHFLTQAFERWDRNALDELTGKMKVVFEYVFNIYEEFEEEMVKEGRDYVARHAKARILDIVRSYFAEARWAHEGYIPGFDEYMYHARITGVGQIVPASAMMGMEPEITDENAFEWVVSPVPQVIRGVEVVGRLGDDIVTHQFSEIFKEEQQRGLHVASGVECYMNEHGVSRDEAVEVLRRMIKDAWKDMNEGLMKPTTVSPRVISLVFNLGRLVDALYKDIDGYTYSAKVMKDDALAVYDEPFPI